MEVYDVLRGAGPLKGQLHELLVYLMNRKRVRDKINGSFS